MAVTDASALAFSNNKVRPLADAQAKLYNQCVQVINAWNAGSYSTFFPNDATVVSDGSPADGRHAIAGSDVNNIITRAIALKNYFERGTLDTSGTANNATLNTVLIVSVNQNP